MRIVRSTLALAVLAAGSLPTAPAPAAAAKGTPGGAPPEAPQPIAHIAQARIAECSGIAYLDGAWFVHNDSGDGPVLYRSAALDFVQTEVLPLAGAQAVDWEDIAVLDGDLLVGDIGDNDRRRDHLVLYRARYREPVEGYSGALELVATYPFRYPDGRHNAEALVVIDGNVHVISKARGKEATAVYRFDRLLDATHLAPGEVNVPQLLATLELDRRERVTAADYDSASGRVMLLTSRSLCCYPRGHLAGEPAWRLPISAGKCEALCFAGDRLIIGNEGREVFALEKLPDVVR